MNFIKDTIDLEALLYALAQPKGLNSISPIYLVDWLYIWLGVWIRNLSLTQRNL
jgi:hypothetical protein